MTWAVRVVTIRGVPVRLHLTFALLALLLLWHTTARRGLRSAGLELLVGALLVVCVLLHELGHALAAHRLGLPIANVTLYPFGGVATLAAPIPSSSAELRIAVAGPIVNLGLAAGLYGLAGVRLFEPTASVAASVARALLWANLLLAGFNLLPAYPLDGGRVLRAALAARLGQVRATVWAASIGQIAGVVLVGLGLLHEPWLALAGVVILPGANSELRRALRANHLMRLQVGELMATCLDRVGENEPLSALRERSRAAPMVDFVVLDASGRLSYLPAARLWSPELDQALTNGLAGQVSLPLAPALAASTALAPALEQLRSARAVAAPVVSEDGTLLGVVTRATLERNLAREDPEGKGASG